MSSLRRVPIQDSSRALYEWVLIIAFSLGTTLACTRCENERVLLVDWRDNKIEEVFLRDHSDSSIGLADSSLNRVSLIGIRSINDDKIRLRGSVELNSCFIKSLKISGPEELVVSDTTSTSL